MGGLPRPEPDARDPEVEKDRMNYWMNETSGVLKPAVMAYLKGGELTAPQIAALRAYLRQWIMAGDWIGAGLLRDDVDRLASRGEISAWLARALELGIDPL
jgi:hypothetical protein